MIPRNFIIVLLSNRGFYHKEVLSAMADPNIAEQIGERLRPSFNESGVDDEQEGKKKLMQAENQLMSKMKQVRKQHEVKIEKSFTQYFRQRKDTMVKFTQHNDPDFPDMGEEYLVPWQLFVRDFESEDLPVTDELLKLCDDKPHRMIDFRPYMIANPFTVNTTDTISKCVSIFRYMHLRHLPVVHPGSGELKGIITRKDLFRFMDL